jgi:hypothetical protein
MSTQPTKRVIRIATLGIEDRTRRTLDVVFKGPGEGAYTLVEEGLAEAVIFDFDCVNAATLWEAYRKRHPKLPTLVMSINHKEIAETVFLRKPIQISSLFQALTEVKAKMEMQQEVAMDNPVSHAKLPAPAPPPVRPVPMLNKQSEELERLCGSVADVHLHDTQGLARIYYNPHNYFQGVLERALQMALAHEHGVLISGMPEPIVLLSKNNRILCEIPDHQLKALCLVPVQQRLITISPLNIADPKTQTLYQATQNLQRCQPLDQMIWKVALWTARGHLPEGTDLQQVIQISRWPNLTRLLLTPYSLQIASLWHKRPYSLLETAKLLDIPQRYVFTFYSGVSALQLLKIPSTEIPLLTPKQDIKQQAFFHRLLSKIWGKTASRVTT